MGHDPRITPDIAATLKQLDIRPPAPGAFLKKRVLWYQMALAGWVPGRKSFFFETLRQASLL